MRNLYSLGRKMYCFEMKSRAKNGMQITFQNVRVTSLILRFVFATRTVRKYELLWTIHSIVSYLKRHWKNAFSDKLGEGEENFPPFK